MALQQSSGKLKLLRVHDVGTKYGPRTDQIDVEVVFILATRPNQAFGFKLRNDTQRLAHQGMLDLLRDAFAGNLTVTTDYDIPAGKKNGVAIRVWLSK
jgi:hypothetical protein